MRKVDELRNEITNQFACEYRVVNKTFVQMLEGLGYDIELEYVKREG